MQPTPYLFFNGTCAEAMTTYAGLFGTEDSLEILTVASMPPDVRSQMPPLPDSSVMHSAVKIGDGWVFAADDMGGTDAQPMAGASISLSFPTEAETRRVYDALAEGGEARMPLEPAFFAPLFGTLTDRFGIRWMVMTDPKA
ncbi:VOC family protein [Frigidibacter sp. ROC022]|uniref:VOC family protein n=1 Tax=Frigidibacter sp. ROC022 TaxID=2971796 RepID=UPI00215A58ED|nr:VOC family protein [Frigidibacter sp. ROC022]MCR8725862.1 VOC family protein [Frigidibacter sp. ROC022]